MSLTIRRLKARQFLRWAQIWILSTRKHLKNFSKKELNFWIKRLVFEIFLIVLYLVRFFWLRNAQCVAFFCRNKDIFEKWNWTRFLGHGKGWLVLGSNCNSGLGGFASEVLPRGFCLGDFASGVFPLGFYLGVFTSEFLPRGFCFGFETKELNRPESVVEIQVSIMQIIHFPVENTHTKDKKTWLYFVFSA